MFPADDHEFELEWSALKRVLRPGIPLKQLELVFSRCATILVHVVLRGEVRSYMVKENDMIKEVMKKLPPYGGLMLGSQHLDEEMTWASSYVAEDAMLHFIEPTKQEIREALLRVFESTEFSSSGVKNTEAVRPLFDYSKQTLDEFLTEEFGLIWTDPENDESTSYELDLSDTRISKLPESFGSLRAESIKFTDCFALYAVAIPRGVTHIGEDCFAYCNRLTSIDIPQGVTSLGDFAFSHCGILTSVTIPVSVTRIGQGAFAACRSLTSVVVPDGVTTIETFTFDDCHRLSFVVVPPSVKTIRKKAFTGCTDLALVAVSDDADVEKKAFPTHTIIEEYATNTSLEEKDMSSLA